MTAPTLSAPHRLCERVNAIVANPVFSYGAIFLLQLRVIWRVWDYKDVTYGDTSSYFLTATAWTHGLHDDVVWSPLYTDFLGTVLAIFHDVPTAMMVHRVTIILVACILILAVMRALLGPALGLLIAVWWAILPANYRVDYEVHLFGVIPILAAVLILARGKGSPRSRGFAFAILLATALLLRNELVIAVAILGAGILVGEIHELRKRRVDAIYIWSRLRWFVIPLAVVVLLFGAAYARSVVRGDQARTTFRAKQTLNFCQVYAYSYQQEHPTRFLGSPWTDCSALMSQMFGRTSLTIAEAARLDPGEVAHYLSWNAALIPSGLQVFLFGATSGGDDPSFGPVKEHRGYVAFLSAIALAILVAGLVLIIRNRNRWLRSLKGSSVWVVLTLTSLTLTTLYVSLAERPRPEYLYPGIICLFALLGLCAGVIGDRVRFTPFIGPIAVVALVVMLFPSHYGPAPRPLYEGIKRLTVVSDRLRQPGSELLASGFNFELCAYLSNRYGNECQSPSWTTARAQMVARKSVASVLRADNISVIYADPILEVDPLLTHFLASPGTYGWGYVSHGVGSDGKWGVLVPTHASSSGM